MDKIKNCPFCGGKPVGPEPADSDWWIECEKCEIIMDNDSKAELIKRWNSRPPNTQIHVDTKPCVNCDFYQTSVRFRFCPDCGRALSQ